MTDPGTDTVRRYIVRWGDGKEDVYDRAGPVTHVYSGVFAEQTIRVLLEDEDGIHPLAGEHKVFVTGAGVVDGTLFILGYDENDVVTVNQAGNGTLRVIANFFVGQNFKTFRAADVRRMVIYVTGGNDSVTIAENITIPVIIDGGDGDDRLRGGGGPSVLLGGAGNDILIGGNGRSVLIGGLGANTLVGQGAEDILIGGRTAFDSDLAAWRALDAILSEWNSSRDFATRVQNLRGGTSPVLQPSWSLSTEGKGAGATVFNDLDIDIMTGGTGMDWFFADLGRDRITDKKPDELIDRL